VDALIGAGGMGEVYRARDTKLNRDIALKVLPESLTRDADRLARFTREAHMLAALNHPNIAHSHGIEHSAGVPALVMELVDGPTLADRIAEGSLALDEALAVARQIALGIEAAHEQGIIHRDLKPANVKLRPDGNVKILDFGLAKALEPPTEKTGGVDARNWSISPTITSPAQMTSAGVILGTAAYMSPEQAKGRPVDKRADVWGFGAVLFEMLTGHRCFHGDDTSETFAAILRATPDWNLLPLGTPPAIRRLLRRCLEKDARSRLSDMAMVRMELREAESEPAEQMVRSTVAVPSPQRPRVRAAAPYALAIVSTIVTIAVAWQVRQPTASPQVVRFSIELPDRMNLSAPTQKQIAISPDGRRLAYIANQRLYLRALDQVAATPVAGTEAGGPPAFARAPFFSPDGSWIAFWQDHQLRKAAIGGGAAVTICDAFDTPLGASWGPDDEILFGSAAGILRVKASGGKAEPLIPVKDGERASSPQALPGGDWVLFVLHPANAASDQGQIAAQSRATGRRQVLVQGAKDVRYVPPGYIVYGRGNALIAQAFDPRRLALAGEAVPVFDDVAVTSINAAMQAAVSSTGTVVYVPTSSIAATSTSALVQVSRDGSRTPLAEMAGTLWFPRYSPEGSRVAFGLSSGALDVNDDSDLWVLDLARNARTRVTFSGNNRFYPIWTREGLRLTFAASAAATARVLSARADGSGAVQTLLDAGPRAFPTSWSPDGRTLALYIVGTNTTRDLWMLTVAGPKPSSTPFVATRFEERGAIFSPDGRWVAYVSNKSGRNDVYARPYPGPGDELTISPAGGQEPVWAPSGRELFYRHDGRFLAVHLAATGASLTVGPPLRVFDDDRSQPDIGGAQGGVANYDVSPDGKRFVVVEELRPANDAPRRVALNVVLNWSQELKQRVPTR